MLALFCLVAFLTSLTAGAERTRSCGPCDAALCEPLPTEGCRFGTVLDPCGCCAFCAAGEGQPCGGRTAVFKRCAPGLECVKSKKSKHGVCVCKSPYEVCGTDGVTYKTGCDLKAASLKALSQEQPEIKVQSKGRCSQAPVIVTVPGEIWNVTGSQVYLSCEAIGIPTPVVTWTKISNGGRKTDLLPGDRDNLAIQTRGGPEKHEVTGWVLISPLTAEDAGTYECHASNSAGETSATGSIHVVESMNDIPSRKVKEEEL